MGDYMSVRMRASQGVVGGTGSHTHLCGAERLVPETVALSAGCELMDRALAHGASVDHVQVTFERVPERDIATSACLDVTSVDASDPHEARACAQMLLARAGISEAAIDAAFRCILLGRSGSGQPQAGAYLVSAANGDLLAASSHSGVRASHFDIAPWSREDIVRALESAGLAHHRTREALILTSKVLACGVLAELCWSDDPTYETGCIGLPGTGYVRIQRFKPPGAVGGRVFFFDGTLPQIEALERRLKTANRLIVGCPTVVFRKASELMAGVSVHG